MRNWSAQCAVQSVHTYQQASIVVDHDLLPVGVLDSGIVLVHEVVLYELYRQGAFTDTTS